MVKTFDKVTESFPETDNFKFKFIPLYLYTVLMFLMTYYIFADAKGLKFQLVYWIVLVENNDDAKIVHYGSNRCKCIATIVISAEVNGLVLGLYYAHIVGPLMSEVLGRKVTVEAYVDSKTILL